MLNNIKLFLEKVGTVLADRRAQIMTLVGAAIVFLPALGVPEEVSKEVESTFGEAYGVVLLAIPVAIKVISLVALASNLVKSWTVRPPSGLAFKALPKHLPVG